MHRMTMILIIRKTIYAHEIQTANNYHALSVAMASEFKHEGCETGQTESLPPHPAAKEKARTGTD